MSSVSSWTVLLRLVLVSIYITSIAGFRSYCHKTVCIISTLHYSILEHILDFGLLMLTVLVWLLLLVHLNSAPLRPIALLLLKVETEQ